MDENSATPDTSGFLAFPSAAALLTEPHTPSCAINVMAAQTSAALAVHARAPPTRARRGSKAAAARPFGATVASVDEDRPSPSSSRRTALLVSTLASAAFTAGEFGNSRAVHAALQASMNEGEQSPPVNTRALIKAFEEAMSAGSDFEKADEAWTRAIGVDPKNAAAWSNRGTKRLQAGRWQDARDDLERSVALSSDPNAPDPLTLNNLGNAEGALGRWDSAAANFLEASKNREMESIALANFALAKFQVGDAAEAVKTTRRILRRDPEFWDMRAAQAAFLWADGREAEAEGEWSTLCRSGRGFGAAVSAESKRTETGGVTPAYARELLEQQLKQQAAVVNGVVRGDGTRADGRESGSRDAFGGWPTADETPCALYADTKIVAPRWPPRCTAALDAFLGLRRTGNALDYDGVVKEYAF